MEHLSKDLNDIKAAGTYAAGQEVNRPDHYAVGGIDVWEYAELKFSHEANVGFHIINTVKYVTRYEHKNGLNDLVKARDSINKAIELLEKRQPKKTDEEILKEDEAWWRQQALEQEVGLMLEEVILEYSHPADWRNPTMEIMRSISGCDPEYRQKNSSARGLFGFLDATRKKYGAETTDWSLPYIQIINGLAYIIDRYGNPHKALEFLNKYGWM